MKTRLSALVILLLACLLCTAAEPPSIRDVLKRIMDRVKENDERSESYGYYYQALFRDLDGDGHVLKEEKRLYRIVWVEGEQYFELLKVDDRDLNSKEISEEAKRRSKFASDVREKKATEFKMKWDDLFAKYDYTFQPVERNATYVVAFAPKKSKLPERSRMEKVYNHIAGKVWVDSDYNVTKANLWLADDVRFGLGILGSLNELELQYSQQKYGSNVWLPSRLRLSYAFRVLVRGRRQQMESRFFDIYPRPVAGPATAEN